MKRLPPVLGEWIDRTRTLSFTFEGRGLEGFAGDVITSALAANDVRIVGRSFKYHRPRGLLSLANADVNALFQAGAKPNVRGDVVPLEDAMQLSAVNTFGGLANDRARCLDWLSPFLPVGFYYKAFHSKRWFPMWERMIRRASGLGSVDATGSEMRLARAAGLDPASESAYARQVPQASGVDSAASQRVRTAKRYAFCEVLVIGAGPAGLSAALAAADAGAQVVIVDENARLGGSGLFNLGGDEAQRDRMLEFVARVESHARITCYPAAYAAGYYTDHWVPLVEATRITKMRARAVVFATGAIEQPAVFRNNDLPGVMLASAAQRLIYRYAVAPGSKAVVLAANDDAYRAARDLAAHGVTVQAVVDLREDHVMQRQSNSTAESSRLGAAHSSHADASSDPGAARFARSAAPGDSDTSPSQPTLATPNMPVHGGFGVYEAVGKSGVLASVRIAPIKADGELDSTRLREIECDVLLMSVGWTPAIQLARQAGAVLKFDTALSQFVPDAMPEGLFACGRVSGVYDFNDRCTDGERAGLAAAAHVGATSAANSAAARSAAGTRGMPSVGPAQVEHPSARDSQLLRRSAPSHPYPIFAHPRGKNFVDFDEDLQLKDFFNAAQEGFDSIELLKRFTTFGMGPSQGKHSNMNASRVLAKIRGVSVGEIGTPTSRPLYHPVPMSHLAGQAFTVERRTPLHSRHAALQAKWMAAGAWQRPEYYEISGKTREQSILEEARAVRENVGIIDVGTLGKIEAHGSDACALLERTYTGRFANMSSGTTRYSLMLDESGVIIDDGVIARISEDHFYFTTTTSGSANVYRELQRNNLLWSLRATLVNLTGQLGAISLAGPRARDVLAKVCDSDLSDTAFPYLAVRLRAVAGVPSRLMRVGFVGELGYEIHAPARSIGKLWDALLEAGARFGIRSFGVEAQRLLRLEKGHIIIGQDTDGLTHPLQIGADWALAMKKPFFVGQRSLRALSKHELRQRLVGFRLDDPNGARPLESHLIVANGDIAGRVTSIAWSPTLHAVIGLALLTPALSAPGTQIDIRVTDGSIIKATVTALPFYDAGNTRQTLEAPA